MNIYDFVKQYKLSAAIPLYTIEHGLEKKIRGRNKIAYNNAFYQYCFEYGEGKENIHRISKSTNVAFSTLHSWTEKYDWINRKRSELEKIDEHIKNQEGIEYDNASIEIFEITKKLIRRLHKLIIDIKNESDRDRALAQVLKAAQALEKTNSLLASTKLFRQGEIALSKDVNNISVSYHIVDERTKKIIQPKEAD
jgi:hypothetical protein